MSADNRTIGYFSDSLTGEQRRDLQKRKYAFLEVDQLKKLHSADGPMNQTSFHANLQLDAYGKLSSREKTALLRRDVRQLAETDKWASRILRQEPDEQKDGMYAARTYHLQCTYVLPRIYRNRNKMCSSASCNVEG